ncbi:MAG: aspartate kinase [Cyanobacteria bacterium SZAS LIN-5]|nr:aspartate kinase [Cyanobacteria bacterium SZAS LIN-5]
MSISVLKFGGTSVKNISRIHHVADVVAKCGSAKSVVVVSAMGDTTDYLYSLAKQCATVPNKRELDLLLSTGEQVSIALLALTLQEKGINAKSFTGSQIGITTDNSHSTARILDICRDTLKKALEDHDVVVVAGFQGLSESGEITTLGRGGSDTTAVALAAACGATTCDIYTDVDGIFTTDPNKIAEAQIIPTICYDEVLELARVGAQVLHPRAVELAKEYNIQVRVRNTFKPAHQGTIINGENKVERIRKVSGIAVDGNQAHVTFTGVPVDFPFIGTTLDCLGKQNVSVDMVSQNIDFANRTKCLSLAIKYEDLDSAILILQELKQACSANDLIVDKEVAKVSIIGAGLGNSQEASTKLLSVLEDHSIYVKLLYCGESRISCLIPTAAANHAAALLHREFKLNELSTNTLVRSA